uniref:Uncharacterized protein n=1 Tax=Arundo donax TaxID=35708 RepID=A0A0A9AXB3_ARUDO
MYLYPLSL